MQTTLQSFPDGSLCSHVVCVCVCVCVCSFPSIFVTVPTDQGETDVYLTLQCIQGLQFCSLCSVLLNQPGSHRRGWTLELFSCFYVSLMPHPLLRTVLAFILFFVLAFIFYREKGSAVPLPRRQ